MLRSCCVASGPPPKFSMTRFRHPYNGPRSIFAHLPPRGCQGMRGGGWIAVRTVQGIDTISHHCCPLMWMGPCPPPKKPFQSRNVLRES